MMLNILTSDSNVPPTWQNILKNLVTDPIELCDYLKLDVNSLNIPPETLRAFPLRVPRPYLARIEKSNPFDPLLLQVLPQAAELEQTEGYIEDPLDENAHNPVPGLLHKYKGRVLLLPTSSCAIHCRYCFRRHFPYDDNIPSKEEWGKSLEYLIHDTSIEEVILSGGDPLMLSDSHLSWLLDKLEEITHIKRLRFHTRLPIMIPERITQQLCSRLSCSTLQTVMVLHCNHANELDQQVANACKQLKEVGITLLNQSVILQGINNDADTLINLSEKLFKLNVLPYYLHFPDKTLGTAHFGVEFKQAVNLHRSMQAHLPGYLVPRLVQENSGEASKTLL